MVETKSEIVTKIAASSEALEFALEAFKAFLPEITEEIIKRAWVKSKDAFSCGDIESLFNDKDFTEADKLKLIFNAR